MSPRLLSWFIISFLVANWLMIFSAMPVLAVILLMSNLTWSLYLSFRLEIPPVAASCSFLSLVLTFTLRKLMEFLLPFIVRLRLRGSVKFFSTGAKVLEMSFK